MPSDPRPTEKIALGWTRDEIVDRFARIMRNKMGPDFWEAPPPEWATEAAETIWQNVEAMIRDRLETDRADIERWKRAATETLDTTGLREKAINDRLRHNGIPLAKWLPSGKAGYLTAEDYAYLASVLASPSSGVSSETAGLREALDAVIDASAHHIGIMVLRHGSEWRDKDPLWSKVVAVMPTLRAEYARLAAETGGSE